MGKSEVYYDWVINALRKKVRETEKSSRRRKWQTIQIFRIQITNKKKKQRKKKNMGTMEGKRRDKRTESKKKMQCV